ncbi:MAG: THUMP domain-containing class I SAM-dependent RNA methyltransferase [Bacteroidota bacterium]
MNQEPHNKKPHNAGLESFTAKTMAGLETALAEELETISANQVIPGNRLVHFKGTFETMMRANYECRTALRILYPVASFVIHSQEQLYRKASAIRWEDFFSTKQTFSIDEVVHDSVFNHTKFAALRLKDAIVDRFRKKSNQRPSVDTGNPDININLHITDKKVTISLDSSGDSLHKRGYRTITGRAPINEVLAAGLIHLSGWDEITDFYDPMCGSGTLLLEALMAAKKIPAGHYKNHFGFQNWHFISQDSFKEIKTRADQKIIESPVQVYGSDIMSKAVEITIQNAKNAGLNHYLSVKRRDFFKLHPQHNQVLLITNPPYDERMSENDINAFYKNMGDALKNHFQGFTAWLISGNLDALKNIGLRSSKRIVLYNGPIESRFAKYELYQGSKRN